MLAKDKLRKVLGVVKAANGTNTWFTCLALVAPRRIGLGQTGHAQCTIATFRVGRALALDTRGTARAWLTLATLVTAGSVWVIKTVDTGLAHRTFL